MSIQEFQYKPQLLSAQNTIENIQLKSFKSNTHTKIIDTISSQLKELVKLRNPSRILTDADINIEKELILNGISEEYYGVWMYYPWNNNLIHLLNEDEFIEVRTNRNKLKITQSEQDELRKKSIGIIGLSVGHSIALTIATERICGELRLADFDTLELSNLNRIRSGVHQLGLPKVIIAAREIAEIDPYLNVHIFPEGITDNNMDDFLSNNNSKLDILVEVCDGLDTKIKARKAARNNLIPVIMDTSDKGMVDIERFDLEPVRKLLHGLIDEDILIPKLTPAERLQLLMKMVSFENISDRLKASLPEMGKSITAFPQLASSVMLGGSVTTDICRKILLGQPVPSGRYYIDYDKLIS